MNTKQFESWIQEFFENGKDFTTSDLQHILHFSLVWNIFESTVCNNFAKPSNIQKTVKKFGKNGQLDINTFKKYFEYYRTRYLNSDGQINTLFSRLSFMMPSENAYKLNLENVLLGNNTNITDVVFSLLFIAYRLRNNLFHGLKYVYNLSLQKELFEKTTELLIEYTNIIKTPKNFVNIKAAESS